VYRLHYKKSSNNTARVAGVSPGPEHRVEMMKIFEEIFSADRSGSIDMGSMRAVMETKFHELLSESIKLAESGVEIVVWAEGAAVIFASDEEKYVEQAVYTSQEKNFYLGMSLVVLCDNYQDLLAKNQPIVKNKLLFITPENRVAWEYSKSNLVLGNEKAVTIPGDGVLKSTKTNKGTVTGAICYDMDFPRYIRQAGVINSDLLIAPSNDWPEIKNTHARMARLRAIENGISLLRPTSNGISIAVDPYGNIMSVVDDNKSTGDPLVAVLPMGSVKTLYAFVGDSWTMICVILGSVLIVLGIARRLREKQLNQGLL
jgi:apolipoprotein N-acyltransferase